MPQYDRIIGFPVVDDHEELIGFIDPKTPRKSLRINAQQEAHVIIQIERKANAPPYDLTLLEETVVNAYKNEKAILQKASEYFGDTKLNLSPELFMSLLVVERKEVPMQDIPRKLILTTRKHLVKRKNDLQLVSLNRKQIPGWTDTLDRVQVTSFVGCVQGPRIFTTSPSYFPIRGGYGYTHMGFSNFFLSIGTEFIYVMPLFRTELQTGENIQLWHSYHRPVAIYSSDRDILWVGGSMSEKRAYELFLRE